MHHYATALRSSNPSQRRNAVKELCQLGAAAPVSSLGYIIPLLQDEDQTIRNGAAEILLNMAKGDGTALVMDHLRDMLNDEDQSVRLRAVRIIGRAGRRARSLVPELVGLLKTKDALTARTIAEALCLIGSYAIPELVTASRDEHPTVSSEAAWALRKIAGVAP
jgi:HEAT repeat protein